MPKEYTPVSDCLFNFFIDEHLPLCKLTKIVFSTLENGIYLKNIHLCMSVFQFVHWRIYTSVRIDKNCVFTLKNVIYKKNIHLSTSLKKRFNEEYLPLCELAIIVFLHLKMLCTWRIYTSVWLLISVFFYLKYIHLCMIMHLFDIFPWSIYIFVGLNLSVNFIWRIYSSARVFSTFFC